MGLDQYAYIKLGSAPAELSEFESVKYEYNNCRLEIAYWRKHPNLQGWMERLWRKQNHNLNEYRKDTLMFDGFNCVELTLTEKDIDQLEKDITAEKLDGGYGTTTGFFFGDNSDEAYKWDDLKFCRNARIALKNGLTVCYNSSW